MIPLVSIVTILYALIQKKVKMSYLRFFKRLIELIKEKHEKVMNIL